MKKTAIVILMLMALLAMTVGTALAQNSWDSWELVMIDDGDADPATSTDYALMVSPGSPTNSYTSSTMSFLFEYGSATNSMSAYSWDQTIDMDMSEDDHDGINGQFFLSTLNFSAYTYNSGTLASFTLTNPGTIAHVYSNNDYQMDLRGTVVYGDDLFTDGHLVPDSDSNSDGTSDPVPPIPEIITIVLIGMGLIALGAYVWYRRRRMAQQTAA